eukprot:6124358-Pyramimonas_sp.AAC.1
MLSQRSALRGRVFDGSCILGGVTQGSPMSGVVFALPFAFDDDPPGPTGVITVNRPPHGQGGPGD